MRDIAENVIFLRLWVIIKVLWNSSVNIFLIPYTLSLQQLTYISKFILISKKKIHLLHLSLKQKIFSNRKEISPQSTPKCIEGSIFYKPTHLYRPTTSEDEEDKNETTERKTRFRRIIHFSLRTRKKRRF